jgi:hypothetical protein
MGQKQWLVMNCLLQWRCRKEVLILYDIFYVYKVKNNGADDLVTVMKFHYGAYSFCCGYTVLVHSQWIVYYSAKENI